MDERIERFFEKMKGKKVAFCGIGVSNTPLVSQFLNKGASVIVCDRRTREQLGETADKLEKLGARLSLGNDYLKNLDVDVIFRTPGMRFNLPELEEARGKGIAVTSEMEVFFDLCPCPIYAVTGSDGKTTTTTIISELLKAQGRKVHLGGNIGRALLPLIEEISPDDVAVVELSSFQLISMRQAPDVAVVTNVSPNHLDVHKDMAEYINAKKNLFLHQNAFSRTVLNMDNQITAAFAEETRGQVLLFSRKAQPESGAYLAEDGMIMMAYHGEKIPVMPAAEIKIRGNHNIENYLAAISAVWGTVDVANIEKVAKSFGGVEHRAEFVRELDGVKYYNDSIATSPTRVISGTLSLYDEKIILIAGGYDKKIPFDVLGPVVVEKVKILILLGATADKIEAAVKGAPSYRQDQPVIIRVQNMQEAVRKARELAQRGDIVSLSPACASFDQYPNFETRGVHFKQLVNDLK